MHSFGDIILAQIQFVDTAEIKTRPALVLFEELGNIVVAGITSNPHMQGIPLTKAEGAMKDSVIKLNYIFTVSAAMVKKKLFVITKEKREQIIAAFMQRLQSR
ncbi:MAG TPA: type II toxin-antitoxin system PemK/MazF family toxin [Candidatus Nanoarchaeia archaeon]|nr:type II toxin-antitoxin system PemK/MazF family toxin [Candidatus Nanoarchaeia archaeon]